MCRAGYGDERALPALAAALDAASAEEADFARNHVLMDLEAAIRDLGGELTPRQTRKCLRARTIARHGRAFRRAEGTHASAGQERQDGHGESRTSPRMRTHSSAGPLVHERVRAQ